MYIKKLEIFSFGCYENKVLEFEKGFNVVYGKNESGKSTIFAFVVYMFYGTKIKKKPGTLSFKEQYTPWNGKAMHGRVTFEHDGHEYVLERLSSKVKSTENLYSLHTGEEIKDREIMASPGEYFFGVSAESFYATAFYLCEKPFASATTNEELITKLTNSVENNSTDVSYKKILETINEDISNLTSPRRKNASIPLAEEKLQLKRRELFKHQSRDSEIQKTLEENEKYKLDIEKYSKQIVGLKEENSKIERQDTALTKKAVHRYVFYPLLVLILLLCLFKKDVFSGMIFGVAFFVLVFFEIRYSGKKQSQKASIRTKFFTLQQNNDKIVLLTEQIAELKTSIARNEERYASCMKNNAVSDETEFEIQSLEKELDVLKKEVAALELAKVAVTNAYNGYKEQFVPKLSKISGEILSKLTDGKYSFALVDDSLGVAVEGGFGYKNAVSLSRGAMHQTDLSLHLALSEILLSEKNAPLFLDDAFAFYDDERVVSAMEYLLSVAKDRQIFFSTCRENEVNALKDKNVIFINLIV